MRLDLNKLHAPRQVVERTYQPSALPPDDDYRIVSPVELSMIVQKAGADTFDVTGRAVTRLELACSRCLEPFEVPVDAAFDLRYVPASGNAGEGEREIHDDDLTTAYYRDGSLDIGELLREQFQLALPMKPLCSDECRGLCLECGANLNRVECHHAPRWEDPRLAPLKGLMKSKE
jgi:uncharacterized protein